MRKTFKFVAVRDKEADKEGISLAELVALKTIFQWMSTHFAFDVARFQKVFKFHKNETKKSSLFLGSKTLL